MKIMCMYTPTGKGIAKAEDSHTSDGAKRSAIQ